MARLSVNLNKIALIRNSRGANLPDLLKVALDCEEFGAQGITIHLDLTKGMQNFQILKF